MEKKEFKEYSWDNYIPAHKIGEQSKTNEVIKVKEMIHLDIFQVFEIYSILNCYHDGQDILTTLRTNKKYKGLSRRASFRKYSKKNKIDYNDLVNLTKSHDILTRSGHGKIATLIHDILWQPLNVIVGNYISTVNFLKQINVFDKLPNKTKDGLLENIKEFKEYDKYNVVHYYAVRDLKAGNLIKIPAYEFDETKPFGKEWIKTKRIIKTIVFTFKVLDDEHCLINDHKYNFKEIKIWGY